MTEQKTPPLKEEKRQMFHISEISQNHEPLEINKFHCLNSNKRSLLLRGEIITLVLN